MSFAFLNLEMYRHESINFNFEWPAVILLHIIISGKRVWILLSLNPGGGGGGAESDWTDLYNVHTYFYS